MIRKPIGAPCVSGASARCWLGEGKPTAAAWASIGGWWNERWHGCTNSVGFESAGSDEVISMKPFSTSDVFSSVGSTSKSFVRASKPRRDTLSLLGRPSADRVGPRSASTPGPCRPRTSPGRQRAGRVSRRSRAQAAPQQGRRLIAKRAATHSQAAPKTPTPLDLTP